MSVDYTDCGRCGESLCDCGDSWNNCIHCGRVICNDCLVEPWSCDPDDGEMNKECCPYCSGVEVHGEDLLKFILDHYNLTREYAEEVYRQSKGIKGGE